jgi:hypothetical protein
VNNRVQLRLVILVAFALPALAQAGNTELIAKREALFTLEKRAEKFRRLDTIYPYHVIRRAGPVPQLPRAMRRFDVTYMFAGERRSLDDLLARSRTQGFLVIKDGKFIASKHLADAGTGRNYSGCWISFARAMCSWCGNSTDSRAHCGMC